MSLYKMKETLTNVIMENPNKSVDDIYRIMRQRGYMIKKENVLKLINELKVIPFMPLIPTQQSLNDAEFMTAQLVDYAHNQIFANIARANELYDFTTDDLNVFMDEYFADSFEFAGKYGNNSNEFKLVETVVGSWLIGDINGNPYTLPSGRRETLGSYYVDMIPRPFITESMDFVTFINTGTNTSEYIAFRGSKTDFSEASMEDWKTNALAFFDEGLAKQSNSFIRARENLKQVLRLYGKPRQFLGYSKGAWLAMLFGEEFSIPTITFNPFFSGLRNIIKDWKQNHTIYRTTEDVASSGLGWAKKSENLVIRNINALSRNVGAILAHKMDNFLDMLSPRLNQPKIASVVEEVNVASHRLKEIELIDLIQERLSSRNADDYGTFENLSQELDDGGGVFAREELRRPGADRVLRSSRLPGPKNRLYALEDPPDYGDTQKKLSFQEEAAGQTRISAKTRFVIVFNRVARALGFKGVDDRYERLVKTSSLGEYEPIQGITDRIYLSGKEILNYLKMPPIDKEAFKTSLKSGIRLATQTFNKLIEPFNRVNNSYFDTMKSEVFSVRNIGVGFGGGLVIGAITNAILANTPLANINPGALAFLSGAITGGVTESIISRFTFVSPAQVSASAMMGWTNFARIGSSAVSLGGGMVAGYYTTQALKQSGAGNVTANVVGGLASVGAGVAISGVASGLATVAGLEAWNPLGWFAGLGAIIAVGIGAIIGVMEDNGEIRMNKEIDYVLKSDSLANQYEYIIDQVGLLGTKPEIILGLQRDLQERQKNPNVMPLSPAEFQNLMNSIITSYSITDLEGTINAQRSTLYNTAQKLGYTDYIPPSYIQSPQNYVDEFNMLVMRGGQRAIDMGFTIKPTPSHTEITPIPPGDVEGFHRDELLAITASMNEQLARLEAERMERMRIAGAIQAQTPMPLANETAIANATNEPVIPPPYLTDVPEQPRQLSETDIRSQVRDALLLRQTAQMDSALSDLEIAKSQTTNANVLAGYQRRIRQLQFEHLDQLNTVRTADLNQQSADAIINNLSNLDSLNLDTEQLGTGGKLRQTYRDNVANKLGILSKQGAPVIPEPTPIPAPKAPAPTPTPEQISDALYGSNMFIP